MFKFTKYFILILCLMILLGCGVYNLNNFVVPDDLEFIAVVESLNTPAKISEYMINNFTYEKHLYYAPDPYTLWKIGKGDCNDFSCFCTFVANHHGYETYQIIIYFKGVMTAHYLSVHVENGKYTYTNNLSYKPIYVETFREVVEHYFTYQFSMEFDSYIVYDYYMSIVEKENFYNQ